MVFLFTNKSNQLKPVDSKSIFGCPIRSFLVPEFSVQTRCYTSEQSQNGRMWRILGEKTIDIETR